MQTIVQLLKLIAVLVASALVGNWYVTETKKKRARGEPWYSLYLAPPGLIVIAAIIMIPIILWLMSR